MEKVYLIYGCAYQRNSTWVYGVFVEKEDAEKVASVLEEHAAIEGKDTNYWVEEEYLHQKGQTW